MQWLAQLLGVTLALTLDLGVPIPDGGESSTSGAHVKQDAHWISIIRDTSMSIDDRLDLVTTDQSFGEWMMRVLEQAPVDEVDAASVVAPLANDPVSIKLREGVNVMLTGFDVISVEGRKAMASDGQGGFFQQAGPGHPETIAQMLTDPGLPDIIGDEMASFLGGIAAGVAASILRADPELSASLATEFAARMQRVPRMLVLSLVSSGHESHLRDGWRAHVSPGDLKTLARDVKAASSYVNDLQRLSGSASRV
jgi:hypothetical protein